MHYSYQQIIFEELVPDLTVLCFSFQSTLVQAFKEFDLFSVRCLVFIFNVSIKNTFRPAVT